MLIFNVLAELITLSYLILTKVPILLIRAAPSAFSSLVSTLSSLIQTLAIIILDLVVFALNLVLPQKTKGLVVRSGDNGYQGIWTGYEAPRDGDSRSPCPYLNALANHGIIKRDGHNLSMDELVPAIMKSFNTSWTMTKSTTNGVEKLFGKSVLSLGDLCDHSVIEHDGSAVRADTYFQPDQGTPTKAVISSLLSTASGPKSTAHPEGYLTTADISNFTAKSLANSKKMNPTFKGLSLIHTSFMGSNLSLLADVCSDVKMLRTVLQEERLPDGFETNFRHRFGYTNLEFQIRSIDIILRVLSQ